MGELTYETPRPRFQRKPKGWRAKQTAKKRRVKVKGWPAIRVYVFARERDICRCCRKRRAESLHEILFRSLGGKVSKVNSIAADGDGVRGCHGFMQRNEIQVERGERGAESTLWFTPRTELAAEWLGIKIGESIESPVMLEMELA